MIIKDGISYRSYIALIDGKKEPVKAKFRCR